MSTTNNLSGYGPSALCRKNYFNSETDDFELWEVKFVAFLRLNKLHSVLTTDPTADTRATYTDLNEQVFAALVQCIDDKSLSLIIRDAKDDGKKALKILRDHYIGSTKPRVIALYTELTSLKMGGTESVTDYLIRGETASTRLKQAGETVSESLLIAMVLKGLPDTYKTFSTVIAQADSSTLDFEKFKISLRNYEENENCRMAHCGNNDTVLKVENNARNFTCYGCGEKGHKKNECSRAKQNATGAKPKRYCVNCRTNTHDTKFCRKASSAKAFKNKKQEDFSEEDGNGVFLFKVSVSKIDAYNDNKNDNFLIDSGATANIICDRDRFIRFDENFDSTKHLIELADSSQQQNVVVARGDAKINLCDSTGVNRTVILKDSLLIPTFKQDIISVKSVTRHGVKVIFGPDNSQMIAPNGTIFNIAQKGKLYYINSIKSSPCKEKSLEEWHQIMGHCNENDVLKLEGVVKGMKISNKDDFQCSTCVKGKMTQFRNHDEDPKATQRLELVHTDISGPVEIASMEGSRYSINFIDDYSGLATVYFLKNKNDAAAATERFIADMAPYGQIKRLRSDNGTEYTSSDFRKVMTDNKIKQEFSSPYSPHQNGTAERFWRTIYNMARCLLNQNELPKYLWSYAVRAATYIRNRCYNNRLQMTPFEAFTSLKPDVSKMEVFGCRCFAYVQDTKKLDDRAREGRFVGYDPLSPAYLVYFGQDRKVKRVRCVKFFKEDPTCEEECFPLLPGPISDENKTEDEARSKHDAPKEQSIKKQLEDLSTEQVERRHPIRERKKPKYLQDYETSEDVSADDPQETASSCTIHYFCKISDIPTTHKEAMASANKDQWQSAMEEEIKALKENDTFELAPRENKKVVGGRWVYSTKEDESGNEICKARYVAKGYLQVQNQDYSETFSPTAKLTSIRMLMDLATKENLTIHQMDVKRAYLNADIDHEIYVEQPPGFIEDGDDGQQLVYRLKKSLYGLKQSGRNWNALLDDFLCKLKFTQSQNDNCVYTRNSEGIMTIIIVWVDDLIIASNNTKCIDIIKRALCSKFSMKDFGLISNFLGIQFELNNAYVKMHQSKFIGKILSRFKMSDCNPKSTPCDPGTIKIDSNIDSQPLTDCRIYREIVGSLIYLMTCTRPDICYVVTKLSQNLANPTNAHLNLAKRVLKYLKGTQNQGIVYFKDDESINLFGYSDSDWGNSGDRRSISGYCFKLSENSAVISWKCRKQPTVALSTCEAEYMALANSIQEGIFLQNLLADFLGKNPCPITIYVDNKGTIDLAKNPVQHQRSKHIDIKFHFIRYHIQTGQIDVVYVPSKENIADLFTKPSTSLNLKRFKLVT